VECWTQDHAPHETILLFAALDNTTGRVMHDCHRRHCSAPFRQFPQTIDVAAPSELDMHMILDNHETHETPMIGRG
jgi:hypothetical protein